MLERRPKICRKAEIDRQEMERLKGKE